MLSLLPVRDSAAQLNFENISSELNLQKKSGSFGAAPSAKLTGQLWYDTSTSALKVWSGTAWSSLSTGGTVTSVFGRTGVVIAIPGDYTTAQVTESGNLYYTNARTDARITAAIGVTVEPFGVYSSSVSGVQNGVNTVFTTPDNFATGSTRVCLNGIRLKRGASFDYTESAVNQITFGTAPSASDIILIDYTK